MQYSLTFLCSALLLPALAAAQSANITSFGNSTTIASSTVTVFPTLTPIHSFPNSTNGTSTISASTTKKNVTATITASDGSLSTATSLVVVTGSETGATPTTARPSASSSPAAGDAVKKVGNSVGAFAIAMGVLFAGHLL